jgi:hypothetical protein
MMFFCWLLLFPAPLTEERHKKEGRGRGGKRQSDAGEEKEGRMKMDGLA